MVSKTNQHGFRLNRHDDKDLIDELNKYEGDHGAKSRRIKELMRKGLQYEQLLKGAGRYAPPDPVPVTLLPYQPPYPSYYTPAQPVQPVPMPSQQPGQAEIPAQSTQPMQSKPLEPEPKPVEPKPADLKPEEQKEQKPAETPSETPSESTIKPPQPVEPKPVVKPPVFEEPEESEEPPKKINKAAMKAKLLGNFNKFND